MDYDSDDPGNVNEFQWEFPAPLMIENEDNKLVTVRQFVTEVHQYLYSHVELLRLLKGSLLGEPAVDADGLTGREHVWVRKYRLPDNVGIFF